MVKANRDFTYEDICKLGQTVTNSIVRKAAVDFLAKLRKYGDITVTPILRYGKVEWVKGTDIKPEEEHLYYDFLIGCTQIQNSIKEMYQNEVKLGTTPECFTARPDQYSMMQLGIKVPSNKSLDDDVDGTKSAIRAWGLEQRFNIVSHAALFYLLYDRSNRGDKRATDELMYLIDYMLPQIKNYVDMATGGEVRYNVRGNGMVVINQEKIPSDVITTLKEGQYAKLNDQNILSFTKDNKSIFERMTISSSHSRIVAWGAWKKMREEFGIEAITWCVAVHFQGNQRGGFSGPLWANAANLVRKHDLGQISDLFFIDQAFSLQHNGGNIFNKLWTCDGLQQVLDAAFSGKLTVLPRYLSVDTHKRIYREVCVETMGFEGTPQQGALIKRQTRKAADNFTTSAVLNLTPTTALERVLVEEKQKVVS